MVSCFKLVHKYKRLILKTLRKMTAYLLNESKDLSSFYSAEGELQNYLQTKIKKIHSAGKFLTKDTNKKVKELLELNSEIMKKLERISQKENRKWSFRNRSDRESMGKDGQIDEPKSRYTGQESQPMEDSLKRTVTGDSEINDNLEQFLRDKVADTSSGIHKTLRRLERCYAQLVSIFVVFPKIIKNIQGLFEDKKERNNYFENRRKKKSKRFGFWKNPYNQKNSFSYIRNIFQKLLGTFSKALISARKVIFLRSPNAASSGFEAPSGKKLQAGAWPTDIWNSEMLHVLSESLKRNEHAFVESLAVCLIAIYKAKKSIEDEAVTADDIYRQTAVDILRKTTIFAIQRNGQLGPDRMSFRNLYYFYQNRHQRANEKLETRSGRDQANQTSLEEPLFDVSFKDLDERDHQALAIREGSEAERTMTRIINGTLTVEGTHIPDINQPAHLDVPGQRDEGEFTVNLSQSNFDQTSRQVSKKYF